MLVNDVNAAAIDVALGFRSQVAFVADDSFVFSASVAENIAYARPRAESREEIEVAARQRPGG